MNLSKALLFIFILPVSIVCQAQTNAELRNLGQEFFAWRATMQPCTGDDILRVERPDGWAPDFSPEAIVSYQAKYDFFKSAFDKISLSGFTQADSIDYLLVRSAIERINWEFNVLRLPNRNPDFYIHQTLGAVYELLIVHSPMTELRAKNIIVRLQSIPRTLAAAKVNLTQPARPGTVLAISNLADIGPKLRTVETALRESFDKKLHKDLSKAIENAIKELEGYKTWLETILPNTTPTFEVGKERYDYFLDNVAYMPYSPQQLIDMGKLEWDRSVAFDTYEKLKNEGKPEAAVFSTSDEQIAKSMEQEEAIRKFMEEKNIMTVPAWVQHYLNKKMPQEVTALRFMGVSDDLTSATRLGEDGVSYIPEPSANLPYFYKAIAQDPRPIIVHEGVPGHYFQLVRSWANPNELRRNFFDSGPIEGIGFYVEEMLLQFGLFDDAPRTRETMYSFMRLRALRVEVDVKLALGLFSIEQAADYLASTVPMDRETAVEEAYFFSMNPGQAISYQIGKLQIVRFLSDAKIKQGDSFSLRDFHDFLMVNGNVPVALQQWEYLDDNSLAASFWPK